MRKFSLIHRTKFILMLELEFIEIIYLFSSFQGLFLISLLLLNTRKLKSSIFLILLIAFFSFYLFENVIYLSGHLKDFPHLYFSTLPLTFLLAPLFYHYIRSNIFPNYKMKWVHLLHLTPFLFELILFIPFYRLPAEIKIRVYESSQSISETPPWSIYTFAYLVYLISSFGFIFAAFQFLQKAKTPNGKAKRKLQWLKKSAIVFLVYIVITTFLSFLSRSYFDLENLALHFGLSGMAFIIYSLGYIAFLFPDFIGKPEFGTEKYQASTLNGKKLELLKQELLDHLKTQKPFLQQDLKPEDLAKALNISKGHLSQVLSEGLKTNYYLLINNHRVEEAKKLLSSQQYAEAKIIHVAFDSGFSNKSSFLRNFKKMTGMTPSEYKKGLHSIQ